MKDVKNLVKIGLSLAILWLVIGATAHYVSHIHAELDNAEAAAKAPYKVSFKKQASR